MSLRLCICQECRLTQAIDPVNGYLITGQYVTEPVYKNHRQRQNARLFGDSHDSNLHPAVFQTSVGPTLEQPSEGPFSAAFSHTFQLPPFPSNSPAADATPGLIDGTTALYRHRLSTISQRLDKNELPEILQNTQIVFAHPPTRSSRPMLKPSENLFLEETVPENATLVKYERWLLSTQQAFEVWDNLDCDMSTRSWGTSIQDRVRQVLKKVEEGKMMQWERQRKRMAQLSHRVRVVNTGTYISRPFVGWSSKLVLCYLLVAFLHLIANVSLKYTKILLVSLRWMHDGTVKGESDLPRDVPTAIAQLRLQPRTKAFVCCPKCFAIYTFEPDLQKSTPRVCTYKRTVTSNPCGAQLLTQRRGSEKPIRLFLYNEFDEWVASLYSRVDIEPHLDEDLWEGCSTRGISDIRHSPELLQFLGPEGDPRRPFLRRPGNEGRLAFSLNMDGFNPLMNKESGKKISIGAMYMVCLNLPPAIRYDLENVYLVGIIPGPHEPSKEEINHVLEPLVDDLLRIWQDGFYLTSTHAHPLGRLVRGALLSLICDLPAARQMSGFASHASTHFCLYCTLTLIDIDNLDHSTWTARTAEEHRRDAEEWRSAPTEELREESFEGSGVRWSQLLRLPYWDPIKHVMIDSMHGFLLRVLQRHCRTIWGMSVDVADSDYPSFAQEKNRPSDEEMERGYNALRHGNEKELQGLKASVRRELARLTEVVPYGGRAKKIIRGLIQYRIRRGWFTADDVRIENKDENPELAKREFLRHPAEETPKNKQAPPTEAEIADGITKVETGFKSSIKVLRKPILLGVCKAKGIVVGDDELKPAIIAKLEQWRLQEGIIDASGNLIQRPRKPKKKTGILGRSTLHEVKTDMASLELPSWTSTAPKNPGAPKGGKFTADQWRSFCILNLVVTLNRLWGHEDESTRKRQMLDNFMHLVSAIKTATMRVVTPETISTYVHHISAYLTGLLVLYPGTTITPYHHLALHFQDFLARYGPVHAWRCFPFERYNYVLQQMPTNMRLGELESTLLNRFCQGQKLHLLLKPHQSMAPDDLDEILTEWETILETDIRGTRIGDVLAFDESFRPQDPPPSVGDMTLMPEAWYKMLVAREAGSSNRVSQFAVVRRHVQRLGERFQCEADSRRNSRIYYRTQTGRTSAGVIQGLFSHHLERSDRLTTFLVVKPFKELPANLQHLDPYRRFPIVGGKLYSLAFEKEELVPLDDLLYHFAYFTPELSTIGIPHVLALPLDR